jgi:hypothetical protein
MDRLLPLNEGDRLVGHVGLQVIALLRRPGRPHRRGVLPQRRIPLAHTRAVEAVEVLGTQAPRPPVERSRGRDLMHRGAVGLADQGGAVPVLAQDLQHGRGAARDDGVVAREPDRALRDRAHAHRMGVTPGQQRRPRRRAHRRGVEVGEAQPLGCQPVEHRGIGWPTEPAHVAIADVVAHDQQHIRCALGRLQRLGKLARRVLQSHLDPAPGTTGQEAAAPFDQAGLERLVCSRRRLLSSKPEAPTAPFDTTSTGQPEVTGRPGRGSGAGDPIFSPRGLRLRSPPGGLSAMDSLRPVLPGRVPVLPSLGFHRCRADACRNHPTEPSEPASPAAGDSLHDGRTRKFDAMGPQGQVAQLPLCG